MKFQITHRLDPNCCPVLFKSRTTCLSCKQFLAHLSSELMRSRGVCRALAGAFCFVTAEAINLPLCTCGLATMGPKPKTQKCYFSWTNGWIISKLYMYIGTCTSSKDTWHNTRVFDLTYFSRSQRSTLKNKLQSWLVLLLFDLECSKFGRTCICAPSTLITPNFGSIFLLQIWPPGGHLGKSTKSYSWTNGRVLHRTFDWGQHLPYGASTPVVPGLVKQNNFFMTENHI
jgi:hypothetical protein